MEDLIKGVARAMKIVAYTFIVIVLLGNLKVVELEATSMMQLQLSLY